MELEFGIFLCTKPQPLLRSKSVIVLAVDVQSALSTVPDATKIERLDGTYTQVIINKAVLKMFREYTKSKKRV